MFENHYGGLNMLSPNLSNWVGSVKLRYFGERIFKKINEFFQI